jgi:hypothetical protein
MCKNWPWRKIARIAAGVVFVGLVASLGMSAAYEICGPNEYTHVKECAQYHLPQFIVLGTVGIADAHNGLITAIATCLLAWITFRLATMEYETAITRRAELRAYIYGKGVKCRQDTNVIAYTGATVVTGYSFWLPYENFGATPAHKLRCHGARLRFPMNTEEEFRPIEWGFHNSVMAGPGEKLITQSIEITIDEALGCWARQLEICLQFHFEYVDVLEPNKVRTTRYEMRLEPCFDPRSVVEDGNTVFWVIPYGPNNCAT